MMIKKIGFTLLFTLSFLAFNFAQELKIGYVNIELVLVYMPESKSMNQQLQTYQQKLGEKLQAKQQYAQTKLQEFQELMQKQPPADQATLEAKQQELIKLDEEIKKEASDADQKLLQKRQEYLEPILEKLNTNLQALAAEEGYDYIINSVDGNGISIILYGPQEHDLTEKLIKKLGIDIPADN